MKYFVLLMATAFISSCNIDSAGGKRSPIENSSLTIVNGKEDLGVTYVRNSLLSLDAGATSKATHTVIILGDLVQCEQFRNDRCQGIKNPLSCSPVTSYFLDYSKIRTFNLEGLSEGVESDFSVFYTNGAESSECISKKIVLDSKPINFSIDISMNVTRNPLLSPKLVLNGPENDKCKADGIPEDISLGASRIDKVEVGIGTVGSGSPLMMPYSEIDKSLKNYEVPMTGLIAYEGETFYTFVKVTDVAGNESVRISDRWTYSLQDPKKEKFLITINDGRFGVFNIQNSSFDMGQSPYRPITISSEVVDVSGEMYFFGKTNMDTETHLFKYDPKKPIDLINPMNLTMGLNPVPVLSGNVLSHKGKAYFIGDSKLMSFNPLTPVSGTNPKVVDQFTGFNVTDTVLSYKKSIYVNATDPTLIEGIFKLDTTDTLALPELYTSDFVMVDSISQDSCKYFAKSGATLEDVIQLNISEPLDTSNPDPTLRNPRIIASGANAMKGPSFVDGAFYFNLDSLPYKGPNFSSISSINDVYSFTKCGNKTLGIINDPLAGIELAVFKIGDPITSTNPGLLLDMNSGSDDSIQKWLGCGSDNEVYFTGKITGDAPGAVSLLKFNPYAVPGINNPRKIPGPMSNLIKSAFSAP